MEQKIFDKEAIILASANGRNAGFVTKKKKFKYDKNSYNPKDKSNWDFFEAKKRK